MELFEILQAGMKGKDGKKLDPTSSEVLESLLDPLVDYQPYDLSFQQLRSKKNIVFKIQISTKRGKIPELIAKLFVTSGFERELEVLKRSQENALTVPQVIDAKEGVILMRFIEGNVLTDVVNETFSTTAIEQLAKWYYRFHDIHSLIKGDPRLRNFIYHNRILYGIDFEESRPGDWMEDVGGVAASLLDTRPIFHEAKQKLAWQLLDSYLDSAGLDRNEIIETHFQKTVANTLKETSRWRENKTIWTLAKKIESNGIPKK
jgi:tRNA A-37 threonylcarbamoyl transferase component Bud32